MAGSTSSRTKPDGDNCSNAHHCNDVVHRHQLAVAARCGLCSWHRQCIVGVKVAQLQAGHRQAAIAETLAQCIGDAVECELGCAERHFRAATARQRRGRAGQHQLRAWRPEHPRQQALQQHQGGGDVDVDQLSKRGIALVEEGVLVAEGGLFPDAQVVDQHIQIGRCLRCDVIGSQGGLGQIGLDPLQSDTLGAFKIARTAARNADDGVARTAQAFHERPTQAPAGADDHQFHVASLLYCGGLSRQPEWCPSRRTRAGCCVQR